MKVGIVGGTGNISASVVRRLVEQGHEVTCITRGDSGAVHAGARHLRGDRNDVEWFVPAMQRERFDAAFDFIAYVPAQAQASLDAFRDVGHFIHTSTVTTVGTEADWLPVTEDHPLRPPMTYAADKVAIDRLYQAAHFQSNFPVTIIKPSTTYGRQRVVRQLGVDTRWLRRIEQGRSILKIGDGSQLHQLLHVDDAAVAYGGVLGRSRCIGQTYFLVHPEPMQWQRVHSIAMDVIGREVEQVGVSADLLRDVDVERFSMVSWIFALNISYSAAKIQRDVPEFRPEISLHDGFADALGHLRSRGLVEQVPDDDWEDRIVRAQAGVRAKLLG